MAEPDAVATSERAGIKASLQATRADFETLVGEIGDAWKKRSGIPAWTCGQLAWHMATSVAFIAGQVEGVRERGKGLDPPRFLLPIVFKGNEVRVRLASRTATAASVLHDFEDAMTKLLSLLDTTDDAALMRSGKMLGETRTIAQIFRVPTEHLAGHARDVRMVLGGS